MDISYLLFSYSFFAYNTQQRKASVHLFSAPSAIAVVVRGNTRRRYRPTDRPTDRMTYLNGDLPAAARRRRRRVGFAPAKEMCGEAPAIFQAERILFFYTRVIIIRVRACIHIYISRQTSLVYVDQTKDSARVESFFFFPFVVHFFHGVHIERYAAKSSLVV